MSARADSSTIKADKQVIQRLRVLARGGKFASIGALLDHLAAVASSRPELLKVEARRS